MLTEDKQIVECNMCGYQFIATLRTCNKDLIRTCPICKSDDLTYTEMFVKKG